MTMVLRRVRAHRFAVLRAKMQQPLGTARPHVLVPAVTRLATRPMRPRPRAKQRSGRRSARAEQHAQDRAPARPRHRGARRARYAERLAAAHDGEHLGKFEELLEAAIDLDRVPDEYLIAASYDPQLQARPP